MNAMLTIQRRFGAVFYIPLFYQAVDGLSAFDAGIRLLPGIIAAVVGSLASGFIIQKTGKVSTMSILDELRRKRLIMTLSFSTTG